MAPLQQENSTSVLGGHRRGCSNPYLPSRWRSRQYPAPLPSSSLCPHMTSQLWRTCGGCRYGPTAHGTPPYLSFPGCLCLRKQQSTAFASSVSLHPEHLRGQHPVKHHGQQQGTVRSPLHYTAQGNTQTQQWLLKVRARRAPDFACVSGAEPALVTLLSCKKDSETKGEPYQT